jgi:hypothetical protein
MGKEEFNAMTERKENLRERIFYQKSQNGTTNKGSAKKGKLG